MEIYEESDFLTAVRKKIVLRTIVSRCLSVYRLTAIYLVFAGISRIGRLLPYGRGHG